MVSVTLPPAGNAGNVHGPLTAEGRATAGQVAPPVVVHAVSCGVCKPTGTVSVTTAPLAAAGPALLMTTEYTTLPPTPTAAGPLFTMPRSASVDGGRGW